MRLIWVRWIQLLLLVGMVFPSAAQPSKPSEGLLAEIRARAEKGEAQSQDEMGSLLVTGSLGLAKDEKEAFKWFRKAAEQNYARAQCNLGCCYVRGDGVTKDEAEAVRWFRKAAEQNFARAQSHLGLQYAVGKGVAKDEAEAVRWFRKAAEQNFARAQLHLGLCFFHGRGVSKDEVEAVRWFRKAAEQNDPDAQCCLGLSYAKARGVARDDVEAAKWFRLAAEQNHPNAQCNLGQCYARGRGVARDEVEAVKWFRKAAEQNDSDAQCSLGLCYAKGEGVPKEKVEADKWLVLSAGQGCKRAQTAKATLEDSMTREQIEAAQKLAREFKSLPAPALPDERMSAGIVQRPPEASGTGFLITEDGYLITTEHVVRNGTQVRLRTEGGVVFGKVVKVDAAKDLALLKVWAGKFVALPVVSSRAVKTGSKVVAAGFPEVSLQGFAPRLLQGQVAALAGTQGALEYFRVNLPVQSGNFGGALVDESGNVIGVVAAGRPTGETSADNVNYALSSSSLRSFLESVPELAGKLKGPNPKQRHFEDVVRTAEKAAVLVLVY